MAIGPDKHNFFERKNCYYFLICQFKHVMGAQRNRLIETVLSVPTTYVLVEE